MYQPYLCNWKVDNKLGDWLREIPTKIPLWGFLSAYWRCSCSDNEHRLSIYLKRC